MPWSRRDWLAATLTVGCATAAQAGALDADPGKLLADLPGAPGVPAVLVFWATYCGFCRRHNAHVDKLFRSVDPLRLRIVGIAVDGSADSVARYMSSQGFTFPVVLDRSGLRQRFTQRRVVPMTCLVDRDDRPGLCIPGEMSEDDVMQLARLALPRP